MEEDGLFEPSEPSSVSVVEVVDLEETDGDQDGFFQSKLREGQGEFDFVSPQLDNISEGTFGEWDTSLVESGRDRQEDKPVSRRDYEPLLMTARISLMEDQQLKLPWESGVLKSIFDDDSAVSLLPPQVLTVPGDLLCGPITEGAASNPYEEGCYTGEDVEDVQQKWEDKKHYFEQYKKDVPRPPCIDLDRAILGFNIDNSAAFQAIEDSKALHARRWQTKEGTYRIKRRALPDVRDAPLQDDNAAASCSDGKPRWRCWDGDYAMGFQHHP